MAVRSGVVALLAVAAICPPLLAVGACHAVRVGAEPPPDQERVVVFELFTPPQTSSGGG